MFPDPPWNSLKHLSTTPTSGGINQANVSGSPSFLKPSSQYHPYINNSLKISSEAEW
jgi:hypothetical protein